MNGGRPSLEDATFEDDSTMLSAGGIAATMFGNLPGIAAATASNCGVCGRNFTIFIANS